MKLFSVPRVDERKRILLVHPSLTTGGTERQVGYLMKHYDRSYIELILVVFADPKSTARRLSEQHKFKLFILGGVVQPGLIERVVGLYRLVKNEKPTAVYTLLANTNLLNVFISFVIGPYSVVWGLRGSKFSTSRFGWKGNLVTWVTPFVSTRVDLLISNTITGLDEHKRCGVRPKKSVVIPNGIDDTQFFPSKKDREVVRTELGIDSGALVIGMVARVVDWKGYDYFLRAAELLVSQKTFNIKFVCVGSGERVLENKYKKMSEEPLLAGRCYWLGERGDVGKIINAMDILTVASIEGEGFPNIIGEAMAAGVPVVSTDIGDAGYLLRDAGLVVEAASAEAIYQGWVTLLTRPELRTSFQKDARKRVLESYSVSESVSKTVSTLLQLQ